MFFSGLYAELKSSGSDGIDGQRSPAKVMLMQKTPLSPTFLSVCMDAEPDDGPHGLVIHSYGQTRPKCADFGEHYNPFGVLSDLSIEL